MWLCASIDVFCKYPEKNSAKYHELGARVRNLFMKEYFSAGAYCCRTRNAKCNDDDDDDNNNSQ